MCKVDTKNDEKKLKPKQSKNSSACKLNGC